MNQPASTSDGRPTNAYPIRAVERVCDILDALQQSREGVSLPEIAAATALPKSSAFRYLAALEARQYVQRDDETATYRLGVAFHPVHTQQVDTLVEVAREVLVQVRDATGETANLGVLEGAAVVHVAVAESDHMMRLAARVGERGAIHSTAMGKAMSATLGDDEVRGILATAVPSPVTERTIVDPDEFVASLAGVRRDGFGLDDCENQVDGRCVAVALRAVPFAAAISVSAPANRLGLDAVPAVVDELRRAVDEIERRFGERALVRPSEPAPDAN